MKDNFSQPLLYYQTGSTLVIPEVPVVYAYATTMRRAQGSTLDLVGLFFDRKKADRGYAYVGVSRVKRMLDAYHLGYIRRTDWLPVGGDSDGNEQQEPSILSESDSEESSDSGDSQASADSFATNPTAWNRLKPRAWEAPTSDEEDPSDGETGSTPYPSSGDYTQGSSKWIMDPEAPCRDDGLWDGLFGREDRAHFVVDGAASAAQASFQHRKICMARQRRGTILTSNAGTQFARWKKKNTKSMRHRAETL